MDIEKRDFLLTKIGNVNERPSIVSLEDFFIGNDDGGSIWCNLVAEPEPAIVFEILTGIKKRPDIEDIKIIVTQFDGGEDEWPFSDLIIFLTSATPERILDYLGEAYHPDEIDFSPTMAEEHGFMVPEGMQVVVAWWD